TTTFLVGTPPTPFHLHTTLLISKSLYFRSMLLKSASLIKLITFSDIPAGVFELLVSWLYTSEITPLPVQDGRPAYCTLLNLYKIAVRLGFEGLQNRVVDVISDLADQTNSILSASDTRVLYNSISESSPIRQLVLDLFAFNRTDGLGNGEWQWPTQFLDDLCVHLKRPNEQALLRHNLREWVPECWTSSCDSCCRVLPPRHRALECEACCCPKSIDFLCLTELFS
ncbi:hypothetical protein P154DRAFT_430628, partial [Amniculicola lignicola CBS 123094]